MLVLICVILSERAMCSGIMLPGAPPHMESLCTVGGTLGQVHTDNEYIGDNPADRAGCL
jgi:hypothetical protein